MLILAAPIWGLRATGAPHFDAGDMAQYAHLEFTRKEVVNAGRALRKGVPWSDDLGEQEKARRIFRIAYNWRDSHGYPMRRVRHELRECALAVGVKPPLVAARAKRMESIRNKLSRSTMTLTQMQDLAGCRAIVPGMADLMALIDQYKTGASAHFVHEQYDYLKQGKRGGYRSYHIVLKFVPCLPNEEAFGGHLVEVQLRTRLQHVWATAVEAVGLSRQNEDLKGGRGNADWLRLFALMSAELADFEGGSLIPDVSHVARERRSELADINKRLDAVKYLEKVHAGIALAPKGSKSGDKYYILSFDYDRRQVNISGYRDMLVGSRAYFDVDQNGSKLNNVFVEVDKIDDLKRAYPNYFLDVAEFTTYLRTSLGVQTPAPEIKARSIDPTSFSWVRDYLQRR